MLAFTLGFPLKSQLAQYQDRIHQQLSDILTSSPSTPPKLIEAMRYATLNNGKRLRPALLYAVGEALQIPLHKLDSSACALELIHSYSLVHDDLPAMDDDDLRRGQPTCHIQYDEATAMLVGDAQQTLAYQVVLQDPLILDGHKITLLQLLTEASGMTGMIAGQMLDIQAKDQPNSLATLETMHQLKTGALIQCALLMGAVQSPQFAEKRPGLAILGEKIGLAFQVHDDILDIEQPTEILGKPQGSDEAANRLTYPKLLGLEAAKHYRDQLITDALNALNIDSLFLKALIQFLASRQH